MSNVVPEQGTHPPSNRSDGSGGASPRGTRATLVRALVTVAVVLAAAVVMGATALIISLRNQALAEAEQRVENVAFMLAEQTDRSFQAVELLEKNLMGRMRALGIKSADELDRRLSGYDGHVLLKDVVSGLSQASSVALVGPQGKAIISSRTWP